MFGRREDSDMQTQELASQSPVLPRVATPLSTPSASSRRNLDVSPKRSESRDNGAERRLTVGKGLSLSGEISACDSLIVEGKVEAKLTEGKLLEITECGQFRGTVEIENADIAGRYDGQLTVHGRLTVRSTGRISGVICYGELEINAGGQIIGEMQVFGQDKAAVANGGKGFKTAAKFASLVEEADEVNRRAIAGA